ncbi:hypothetical protein D3C86_1311540 [compost metagenome]
MCRRVSIFKRKRSIAGIVSTGTTDQTYRCVGTVECRNGTRSLNAITHGTVDLMSHIAISFGAKLHDRCGVTTDLYISSMICSLSKSVGNFWECVITQTSRYTDHFVVV